MPIPLRSFSDYFMENIAAELNNQLQISSICNADCLFCSNKQNPFKIERLSFRDVAEIEKVIFAKKPFPGPLILAESLPGRISEGEALIHPQLFQILDLIRSKFDNSIHITTNGAVLTKEFIKRLARYAPMEIKLSIPSVNPDYWMENFKLGRESYDNAINSIDLLFQLGIEVFPTIIPMPAWVGWKDIEETVRFLRACGLRNTQIYAPGYTKYTNSETLKKLQCDKFELSNFLAEMGEKYGMGFEWAMDPKKELNIAYKSIIDLLRFRFHFRDVKTSFWFTSVAAYDRFVVLMQQLQKSIPVKITIIAVENEFYGGNIESTGLWVIADIRRKIEQLNLRGENIVMPNGFLDRYGFDLTGESILDYQKICNNTLILVEQ